MNSDFVTGLLRQILLNLLKIVFLSESWDQLSLIQLDTFRNSYDNTYVFVHSSFNSRHIYSNFLIHVAFYIHKVDTVRLTIQPNTVTVGGQTGSSTPYPTLTPAEVVMNCQLDTSAERVSYLYLKRKQTQENVFTTFAEMYPEYTEPRLTQNAPQDIKSKSPTLSGSTSGSNARLEARFYVHQMTCQDDAMYQCTINFKRQMSESHEENFNASLTVTG